MCKSIGFLCIFGVKRRYIEPRGEEGRFGKVVVFCGRGEENGFWCLIWQRPNQTKRDKIATEGGKEEAAGQMRMGGRNREGVEEGEEEGGSRGEE